jgi:hypothetical protein
MVVSPFPMRERDIRVAPCREDVSIPELLLIDAMTALNLPVLLRASGLDIPMPNACSLDCPFESQREFGAVVALKFSDGKGQVPAELLDEVQARVLILPGIQPQHAIAGAIVDRRVLKHALSGELHNLDVDLD